MEFHYTFLHQHSKCALPYLAWPQYFISGFQPFVLVLQATNAGGRSHGYEAKAEVGGTAAVVGGTAAVGSIPDRMLNYMYEFNFRKY